jgi:hypothetical protein
MRTMDRKDRFFRRVLWSTAVLNLGAAVLFTFPDSLPGRILGLPATVPLLYRVLVGLFVALFGGVYAWLAVQATIDRPLVALGAIGKAGAFGGVLLCWVLGATTGLMPALFSADLLLAGIFAWWLADGRSDAVSGASGSPRR